MNSNEAHSHVFGGLLRKLGWLILLCSPHTRGGVVSTGTGIVLPHNFSCPPLFVLTARGIKGSPQFMTSLFQCISQGTRNLCSQTAPPYRSIRTDVPRFTHKLQYINKFRGRSQFSISQNASVCLCACTGRF